MARRGLSIAMATAMATAMAVIRPEHAEGGQIHENLLFRSILVISGPSRRQKWIRLKISSRMVLLKMSGIHNLTHFMKNL